MTTLQAACGAISVATFFVYTLPAWFKNSRGNDER